MFIRTVLPLLSLSEDKRSYFHELPLQRCVVIFNVIYHIEVTTVFTKLQNMENTYQVAWDVLRGAVATWRSDGAGRKEERARGRAQGVVAEVAPSAPRLIRHRRTTTPHRTLHYPLAMGGGNLSSTTKTILHTNKKNI